MLFKNKGKFFLNLDRKTDPANSNIPGASQKDSDQLAEQTEVTKVSLSESVVAEQQFNSQDSVLAGTVNPVATLESITNDLEKAEAPQRSVSCTTFAPDNLLPGSGLRPRNRRPGAALKDFRSIAQDLFGT